MNAIVRYSLIAIILLLSVSVWAQEFPGGELNLDYSYARFAPNASGSQGHSLNGGGGSFVFNLNQVVGIKMDFQGYGSNTSHFVLAPSLAFPTGAVANIQGNLFTYMFGPQIKLHNSHMQPFVHALFGGAHSNVYANAFKNICGVGACAFSRAPANNAFAMAYGGGVDIPIGHAVSIRPVELDYLFTDFTNQFNNAHQNNFRYSGGITFNLGTRGASQ